MNPTINGNALSEFLKEMVGGKVLEVDVALEANELPTHELQEQAVEIYRDHKHVMRLVVQDLLRPSSPHPSFPAASPNSSSPAGVGGGSIKFMDPRPATAGDDVKKRIARWGLIVGALWLVPIVGTFLYQGLSWPVKWAYHHLSSYSSSFPAATGGESIKQHDGSPTGALGDDVKGAVVFQITSAHYAEGNKMELHWNSLGTGYTYLIFETCHPESDGARPITVSDRAVSTLGARINMNYDTSCPAPVLQVMPQAPSGASEPMSDPVVFHLSPLNDSYSVEPLAMEATAAQSSELSPAPPTKKVTSLPHAQHAAVTPTKVGAQSNALDSGFRRNDDNFASTNRSVPVKSAPVKKPSPPDFRRGSPQSGGYISAFTKHLLSNADGAIASVVPYQSVGQGIIATKNAALTASDESRGTSEKVHPVDSSLVTRRSSLPVVPVPTGLTWQPIDAWTLRLMWKPLGSNYRYNLYGSPVDPIAFTYDDPENHDPMTEPVVIWNAPHDKGKRFIFELRALDTEGHESASSKRVEGDLP